MFSFDISNTSKFTNCQTPLMTIVSCRLKKNWLSLKLTSMYNRMSYFMNPDLLLHGLFNTHSPRQNKYLLFLKLKISLVLVSREQAFNCFVNKTPWIDPAMPEYYCTQSDILSLIYDSVSNSYRYCIWCWSKIPGMLNERGKLKQTDTKWAYILRNTPCSCELYLHLEMGMNYWWL